MPHLLSGGNPVKIGNGPAAVILVPVIFRETLRALRATGRTDREGRPKGRRVRRPAWADGNQLCLEDGDRFSDKDLL